MKTIYFIRHGQSEGNTGPVRQDGTSSLTAHGREQAIFMAERCAKLPIDIIVSSTMTRAQETASIIGDKIGKEVISSEFFTERRRPSAQTGKPKEDPNSLQIDRDIWNNFGTERYRHSDEENFEDLRDRARKALQFLADRPEESIAVVTHGFFMRIVLAYVVFRERLTGKECELVMRTFHMENTGLTIVKYAGADKEPPWWVWTWNDHAHLG
jgi:probable phosphoglycerate mutase